MKLVIVSATDLVVQNIILGLHACHEGILSQVILAAAVLLVGSLDLIIKSLYIWRKQAVELEQRAFFIWKGRSFVELV